EEREDPSLAFLLANMSYPQFPEPIGIFRRVERPSYETLIQEQIQEVQQKQGKGTLESLLYSGETWTVE
ncbi:MAG TPA: 2-oxoacid:ferredoxin oxidoreductase subunit beta, partial [bacterium]|nr:2-oxoacid:ferredoxin oxidoreductase subunit beta [bacterium]